MFEPSIRQSWIVLTIGLFILLGASEGFARWATPADANSKVILYKSNMLVEKNLSITETEMVTEILKDGGRDSGTFRYGYDPETTSVKIIEAYTLLNKQKFPVPSSAIVDKAVQVSTQGFDQRNDLVITFPRVEIGSQTHLKIKITVRKYPLKVFTWRWLPSGWGMLENVQINVVSKIPLFSEFNNPQNRLSLKASEKAPWRYEMTNTAPIYESVADEARPIFDEPNLSWWKLSEVPTYSDLLKRVLPDYEKVIGSPLPQLHKDVLAKVKGDTLNEKLNSLTSALQERMRYMGDWRGVKGGYVPRSFEEVAKHASGDCKDYGAGLTAMLRTLGYKAYPAIVWSGESGAPDLGRVPYEGMFNHLIVVVEIDGQKHWVDPTDLRSFAQGIPPHILGRPALVLDPAGPRVEHIPEVSPQPYNFEYAIVINAEDLEKLQVTADIKALQGGAYWWTLWSQYMSPESIQKSIAQQFFDDHELEKFSFAPLDFSRRVVGDVNITGTLTVKPQLVQTTQGKGIYVRPLNVVSDLNDLTLRDRVADYFWSTPVSSKRTIEIQGRKISGRKLEGCRIESPWFSFQRLYEFRRSGFVVQDQMQVRKGYITNKDMQSPDFRTAFDAIKACTQRVTLIF